MRQVRLGHWPAMGPTAALVAWQQARDARATGVDPATSRTTDRRDQRRHAEKVRKERAQGGYTVRGLADDFLSSYAGTVVPKTHAALERLFARELDPIADVPASALTRTQAFALIDAMQASAEKRNSFLAKKAIEIEQSTRTLQKLLDAYVENLKAQGRRSHVDVHQIFKRHVTEAWPTLASAPALDFAPDQALDMLRRLIEVGKGRTANKLRS